jgi:4'-phosphopantetheinyl transferase EntD
MTQIEGSRMIETLFPKEVLTFWSEEEPDPALLYPEEAECVRNAVLKRRREFALGRLCARRALAEMGIRDFPLLVKKDRSPAWPEEITGSLSHCEGFCAVALARRSLMAGLGLDVEAAEPLDENLVPMVCDAGEMAGLAASSAAERGILARLVFSAKESVFKCVNPLEGVFLDFHDCRLELDPLRSVFIARISHPALAPRWEGMELRGRFAGNSRRLFTGVALPAPA